MVSLIGLGYVRPSVRFLIRIISQKIGFNINKNLLNNYK
ncbi:MAG: hypothetical protein ACJASH_001288 [Bermanella sp.]|jgi:hypothetical protein